MYLNFWNSTHRERKEQYIKALELEVARLRELFVNESNTIQAHLQQTDHQLREQQHENLALREILKSRNIAFDLELQQRKNAIRSMRPSDGHDMGPAFSALPPNHFNSVIASANSQAGLAGMQELGYINGTGATGSNQSPIIHNNQSPITTHHSTSPPAIQELGKVKMEGVPGMPGIFELEPQLGVDFILA